MVVIFTLFSSRLIIGGNLGILLLIIFIYLGLIAITIYSSINKNKWKAKKLQKLHDKEKKYVLCPRCKHLVDKELSLCENCGNQM